MSTQLGIFYKLKEALETGNPEIATPFMADDFTHQVLPAQYVSSAASALNWGEIGTDIDQVGSSATHGRSMGGARHRNQHQSQVYKGEGICIPSV